MILSLVNVKGGVGKTTTAVNLAAGLAEKGLRVLLVDLDPQGSATHSVASSLEPGPTLADVLLDGVSARDALYETGRDRLDLLPGDLRLAGADLELARKKAPERLLADALRPVSRSYDVVVIDSPPGLSILTTLALYASSGYIVPTAPQELAAEALSRFFEGIERLKGTMRRATKLVGILLTMVDHRTALTDEMVTVLRRRYGRAVFRTEIPINVRLAEAPRYGGTILDYQSWSTGGIAYRQLVDEVLKRLQSEGLL